MRGLAADLSLQRSVEGHASIDWDRRGGFSLCRRRRRSGYHASGVETVHLGGSAGKS
jgi:hypothetical protein